MTLDDWRELAGHIASEANDTGDKKLQRRLDTIFSKIQDLLDSHTDEEPSTSLKMKQPLAEESVQLAEWAARMLIGAEQLGIKSKPVARFPLPRAQRAILLRLPIISANLQETLAEDEPHLTVGDVGGLLIAVSEALLDAPPLQQFALILTAKRLEGLPGGRGVQCGQARPRGRELGRRLFRIRITLKEIQPRIGRLVHLSVCTHRKRHVVVLLVDQPPLRLPRRHQRPCVHDDVRYPVQPWTPAYTNPTWNGISRSDRCQIAQATQENHPPLQVASSGVTWGSDTPLPRLDPGAHETDPRSGRRERQRRPRHRNPWFRGPASSRTRRRGPASPGCSCRSP